MTERLTLEQVTELADEALGAGRGLVLATVVRADEGTGLEVGSRLVLGEDGMVTGSIGGRLDDAVIAEARAALEARASRTRSFRTDGEVEMVGVAGGAVDVFLEVLAPPARLVIVGAGHIAVPLARIASILDFEVVVIDDRAEYASQERFPLASRVLVGPYRQTLAGLELHRDTYVVLVTRGHVHDRECLEQVLGAPVAYIGMIGSKRRVRTVMQHARERGADPEVLRRVHAPIGLDIGAQSPAEIAVAIMAEIVNVRRGGRAPSLRLGERQRV